MAEEKDDALNDGEHYEQSDYEVFRGFPKTYPENLTYNAIFGDRIKDFSHLTGLQRSPSDSEFILAQGVARKIAEGSFSDITFDSQIAPKIKMEISSAEDNESDLEPHELYSTTANRFMKKLLPQTKEILKGQYDRMINEGKFKAGKFTNLRAMGVWFTLLMNDFTDYFNSVRNQTNQPSGRYINLAEDHLFADTNNDLESPLDIEG